MIETFQETNIKRIFDLQKSQLAELKNSTAKERIKKIQSIVDYLSKPENEERLAKALYSDMKKPYEDVVAAELVPVFSQARYVKSNIRQWMRPKRVPTPMLLKGLASYIQYEPKGSALIISPWNYPFQLAIWPLIYAIAAGCSVIIKPSEISANTASYIKEMIDHLFDPHEVAVVIGGVEVSTELLSLPFDHIHFTGSPQIGKIVMKAASKNLTSVTLELGGKCPAIIDQHANVKDAAQKIAWGKNLNCGQTCLAPDYILIHEFVKESFLNHLEASINSYYNDDQKGIEISTAYGRIVSDKHFERINGLLEDAIEKGANIHIGGKVDKTERYISPTVISNVDYDMKVMQEEIFGPILPVMSYSNFADLPQTIAKLPKPLSLYIFSKKRKNVDYILNNTSSGGAMVNDLMLGSINTNLPFGGVNNSGIGKANGHHGFVDFCNEKAVMKRKYGTLSMIYPPFNRKIINAMKWASKWL